MNIDPLMVVAKLAVLRSCECEQMLEHPENLTREQVHEMRGAANAYRQIAQVAEAIRVSERKFN